MTVILRQLDTGDFEAWKSLWQQYLAFYGSELADDIIDNYWQRLMSNKPYEYSGIVTEVSGEIVGLAHYLFHRHGWYMNNVCYLQDLFVLPDHRKSGLGKMLIEGVYTEAKDNQAEEVYWVTQKDNTSARKLYDKIATDTGFVQYKHILRR